MKKILCLLSVLTVLALPLAGQAQESYAGTTTLISGGTNNVAATATNTYSLRIDVPRTREFALHVSAKPLTTNVVTLRFWLYPSLDGTTYSSTEPVIVSLSGTTNAASPSSVSLITNITAGPVPHYFLKPVGNTEGVASTNLTVKYGFKK
jgi:hypothetical protein